MDVAPESDRHVVGEDFGDATEGISSLGGGLDLGDHGCLHACVEAADFRGVHRIEIRHGWARCLTSVRCTETDHVTQDPDVDRCEERLGQGSSDHTSCGLTSRRPLQDISSVVEAVLLNASEVGVTRSRLGVEFARATRSG